MKWFKPYGNAFKNTMKGKIEREIVERVSGEIKVKMEMVLLYCDALCAHCTMHITD